jgi:hypothetical protein
MQNLAFTDSVDLHITYFEYSVLVQSVNVACKKFLCKVRFMCVRVTYLSVYHSDSWWGGGLSSSQASMILVRFDIEPHHAKEKQLSEIFRI